MKLLYYIEKAKRLPFKIVIKKAYGLISHKLKGLVEYLFDCLSSTYNYREVSPLVVPVKLFIPLHYLLQYKSVNLQLANLYTNHYFDLLGSGWTRIFYGMRTRGLEGFRYDLTQLINPDKQGRWLKERINISNLKLSKKIWQIINSDYQPIDWQLDFKSGYRWSEKIWYKNIEYGNKLGSDVKVPWELARMQHLPILAYAYILATRGAGGFQTPEVYRREFRNQVLDFISLNPPRFGVNWVCTMDVGIRVTNWLIAYDLFKAAGAEFDNEFDDVFAHSIYDHGLHIINNLEYSQELRSNHYLSNIAGLLFVAAHLQCNEVTDRWLAFAVQEIINEMSNQFYQDGGNFEASTSYHRLSTEIMLYSAIICLCLPKEKKASLIRYSVKEHHVHPKLRSTLEQLYNVNSDQFFPDWFWERLEKACEFTLHITKPNGEVLQIGDNDSGRFLKLWPSFTKLTVSEAKRLYKNLDNYCELPLAENYYDENILDHRHILAVAGVLFNRADFLQAIGQEHLESKLVEEWLGYRRIKSYHEKQGFFYSQAEKKTIIPSNSLNQWQKELKVKFGEPVIYKFSIEPKDKALAYGLKVFGYPDFGLYIYKSYRLYLTVRCGSIGQNGNGGHAHNDQLSVELTIDGKNIIKDPGTYLYTPLTKRRNQYRSIKSHFVPQVDEKEQNEWEPGVRGLFSLFQKAQPRIMFFDKSGFVGAYSIDNQFVYRIIKILDYEINILDYGSLKLPLNFWQQNYSNGYGKWLNDVKRF